MLPRQLPSHRLCFLSRSSQKMQAVNHGTSGIARDILPWTERAFQLSKHLALAGFSAWVCSSIRLSSVIGTACPFPCKLLKLCSRSTLRLSSRRNLKSLLLSCFALQPTQGIFPCYQLWEHLFDFIWVIMTMIQISNVQFCRHIRKTSWDNQTSACHCSFP